MKENIERKHFAKTVQWEINLPSQLFYKVKYKLDYRKQKLKIINILNWNFILYSLLSICISFVNL